MSVPNKQNTSPSKDNSKADPSAGLQKPGAAEDVIAAREEASADIEEDPDFSLNSPNDDLDEGETARLGEDKTSLI